MVSVSIVTFHTQLSELEICIASLDSHYIDCIYIIDNGEEERIRIWCDLHPEIIYIPAHNPGFGAGHNIAIRKSIEKEAKYHLVLNSDVHFNAKVIDEIIEYMEANPKTGTLQPKILNPDGSLQHTCRLLPTPLDVFARRFLPSFLYRKRNDRYLLKNLDPDKEHNIPYHQGSFMFIRVDALRETGLFDERFFMYPEDIDLTRRLHKMWKTMYYPGASIIHSHRADSYHSLKMTWIHIINMIKYFNKWGWWFDKERRQFNKQVY